MTVEKPLTTQERLALVRKAQAERAAQQPDAMSLSTKAKSVDNKRKMALSRAAIARQEQEWQEAAKTKVEKVAEGIAKRNKAAAKHESVQRNLDAVAQRKAKAPKIDIAPVPKVKEQQPMSRETSYDIFMARTEERDKQHHLLLKQADGIKKRMQQITNRERTKLAEALRDCYGIFEHIEANREPWKFYELLRSYFKVSQDQRIQSNTPDECLLLRYVLTEKSKKQISEYGTVLRYALDNKIAKNDFVRWYTGTTQTKILAAARGSNTASTRDRLMRARQLLQRYFDIREESPLGVMEYPERLAARQVHLPDDLIFVICRGGRRFDRGSGFNPDDPSQNQLPQAEVRALHFIPPIIDVADEIVNRLARYIVPQLEKYEEEIAKKTQQVWANDLTSYLTESELGTAYNSADKWADRMQAAVAEDQQEFAAQRKKIQKIRNASRK
jgi:plasmid stabilization system protein ParE